MHGIRGVVCQCLGNSRFPEQCVQKSFLQSDSSFQPFFGGGFNGEGSVGMLEMQDEGLRVPLHQAGSDPAADHPVTAAVTVDIPALIVVHDIC